MNTIGMKIDFDAPHLEADPWGYASLWYEQRRRQLIGALLPKQHLGQVAELGCSTGLITHMLAPRASQVWAIDISEKAVALARNHLRQHHNVQLVHGHVLQHWPEPPLDTVLFCDVGYYWSAPDLAALGVRLDASLSDDGFVLLAHWRHHFDAVVTPTMQVHELVQAHSGLHVQLRYEDKDWLVHGLSRSSQSVAEWEGLV